MMWLFRSVVGKLWFTILLLVSCVLFILTILLIKFFEEYYVQEAENDLTRLATKVAEVMHDYRDEQLARSIAWTLVDNRSKAIIVADESHYWYSPGEADLKDMPLSSIREDSDLRRVLTDQETVKKRLYVMEWEQNGKP